MNGKLKMALISAAAVLGAGLCAALFVELGIYDIAADDHHTKLTLAIIVQLRDRSVEARLGQDAG